MLMRGIERLWRAARWPRSQSEGKVLILLYHRIAELHSDPWGLAVTPRRFAEHVEALQQHARVMRLRQLHQGLLKGDLPDRSVVITFDDGYADNLHNAKPVLERYDVPATVFVTTGYVGQEKHEFWWDELDRIFLQPGVLPEKLSLNLNGSTYQWEMGEAACYSEEASKRHRRWRSWEEEPTSRHSLYNSLWKLLRPMNQSERQRVLHELGEWADIEPAVRPSHRPLSVEEMVTLSQEAGGIEVGAHTITHSALRKLSPALQRDEILGSKVQLEEILNRPVTSFAYPYGSLSEQAVSVVREAGFSCACSTRADIVESSTNRFRLPRVEVQDWNKEEFVGQLSKWFSD